MLSGGRDSIEAFYRGDRRRVVIIHDMNGAMISSLENGAIAVLGKFDSCKPTGEMAAGTFQDYWVFDDKGFVTYRVSTLGLGGSAVKK